VPVWFLPFSKIIDLNLSLRINLSLLYDFNIFTDKMISARHPDLIYIDKEKKQMYLIDIACVMDRNVIDKEKEKIDKRFEFNN